jgi:hypothetical protein
MSSLFANADLTDETEDVAKVDSNAPFDERTYFVKWTRDASHRAGGWFEVSEQLSGKKIKLTQERALSVQTGKFVHSDAIFLPDNPADYPFDHFLATGTLLAWAAGTRNGMHGLGVRHKRHECKDDVADTTAVLTLQSPWMAQLESGTGNQPGAGKAKALCAWFSAAVNIEPYISPTPKLVVYNDPYVYGKEKLNNECLRCTHCNAQCKLEPAIHYPFTFPHYAPDSLRTIVDLIDSIQNVYRHKAEIAKAAAARFGGKRMFKDTKAKIPMTACQLLKMLETSFAATHSFFWYNFVAHALGDISEHKRYQSTQYFGHERKQPTSLDLAKLDAYLSQVSEDYKLLWNDRDVGNVFALLQSFCMAPDKSERERIYKALSQFRGNDRFPTHNALSVVDETPINFHLGHKLSVYKPDKSSEKLTYGTQVVLTMLSCIDVAHYIVKNQQSISPSERALIEDFVKGISPMVAPDLTKCPGHSILLSVIHHFYGEQIEGKSEAFWKAFAIQRSRPWSIKTWKSQRTTQEQISKTDLACFMLSPAPIETRLGGDVPTQAPKKRAHRTFFHPSPSP